MFKRFIICGVALLIAVAGARSAAQMDLARVLPGSFHISLSRQFVVHDPPVTDAYPYYPEAGGNLVRLDPTLLAVSCERIKETLLKELDARDQWQGKIVLNLYHDPNPNAGIVVTPESYGGDWVYQVTLPDYLERYRVVSLVVQLVMLEMADRNATHSAELPIWLAEGMTRQVMLSSQVELVLEAPRKVENGVTLERTTNSNLRTTLLRDGAWAGLPKLGEVPNSDPLAQTLETLRTIPPLGIEELSWPREGQFEGQAAESYRCSAQLFVSELLHLPNGRAALRAFLPELSQHLNWQIAFLQSFQADFGTQLELEKWWALRLVQLTGRDLLQAWSNEDSWNRLDEVLNPTVQIRSESSELPMHGRVTLQAVITEWDLARQKMVLPEALRLLGTLRARVAPSLVYLVDDYRRVLNTYLYQRDRGVTFPTGKTVFAQGLDGVARDAVRELDALDQTRQQLRPKVEAPQPIAASNQVNN